MFALAAPFLRQVATVPVLRTGTPVRKATRPPGTYSVGVAPKTIRGRLVPALVVTGAGLLVLLVLVMVGRRARSRRAVRL